MNLSYFTPSHFGESIQRFFTELGIPFHPYTHVEFPKEKIFDNRIDITKLEYISIVDSLYFPLVINDSLFTKSSDLFTKSDSIDNLDLTKIQPDYDGIFIFV